MKTVRAAVAVVRHGDEVLVVRPEEDAAAQDPDPQEDRTERDAAGDRAATGDGTAAGDGATAGDGAAPSGASASDCWEFPTAELARKETARAACVRAVGEQTGLRAMEPRAFYTIEYHSGADRLLSMECFFCTAEDADEATGAEGAGNATDASEATDADSAANAGKGGGELEGAAAGRAAASDTMGTGNNGDASDKGVASAGEAATCRELRWVPRAKLPSLVWAPASAELARVVAASDEEGDQQLIKRRADSRKSMQGNKRANTKPELLVRQRLREAGLPGYRLQWKKAPGHPDIAYPGRKVAIFVNGCFWHRCPLCQPPVPKRNREFWEAKFARNVERDARVLAELEEQGWTAITIWECELKKGAIDDTMERVVTQVRAAQPSRPGSR